MSLSKKSRFLPNNGSSEHLDHKYNFSVRATCPNLWELSESHQFPFLRQIFCREDYLPNRPEVVRLISLFVFQNFAAVRIKETRRQRLDYARNFSCPNGWVIDIPRIIANRDFKLPAARVMAVQLRVERHMWYINRQEGPVWTCRECTVQNVRELLLCGICGSESSRYIFTPADWDPQRKHVWNLPDLLRSSMHHLEPSCLLASKGYIS